MSEENNNTEAVNEEVVPEVAPEAEPIPVAENAVEGAPSAEELEKQKIAPGLDNATSEEDEALSEGDVA